MRKIDRSEIAAFLPEMLGDATPGYALAVIDGDEAQIVCQGMASLEHQVAIDADTAFRIASVTKQFLALVTLIQHDRAVVDLGAPLGRYVGELRGVQAEVTLRQALGNCSGIRDHLELAMMAGGALDQPVSVAQSLEMIARQSETNFPPGDSFLYSNANFLLVTLAVERASGREMGALMEELLFRPCAMAASRYEPSHRSVIPNMATGYLDTDAGFLRAPFGIELTGEGAVVSTLADLVRWRRYLRDDPDGLIARISQPTRFPGGETGHYGMGLFNRPFHGAPSLGHSGLWPGYRTDLIHFPELDLGLICIVNLNSADPMKITRSLAKLLAPDQLDLSQAAPDAGPLEALTSGDTYLNDETLDIVRFGTVDGKLQAESGGWVAPADIVGPTQASFRTPLDYLSLDWSEVDEGHVRLTRVNGTELTLSNVGAFKAPTHDAAYIGRYRCPELPSTLTIARDQSGDGLEARLRGAFAHGPAWRARPLTSDMIVLSNDSGPWPRQLVGRLTEDGLRLSGARARNMRFLRQ